MPEVIVVDEIGTAAEATACRTIAERGVTLVATAHGQYIENLMNNPLLSDLVGGLASVTLGDDTARSRNCQKAVLERKAPSTFPVLIEMRERNTWVEHKTEESVDSLLLGDSPYVKVRAVMLLCTLANMPVFG
jgi:Sporulation stage III, protein AA